MAGAGNDQGAALDRITESVAAKFAVRVMMPLLTLIAIPLIVAQWRGMVGSVGQLGTKIEAVSSRQASLEREVTTINTKLDAGLIWRLTELERRFEAMQDRIDARGPAPAAPPR